MATAPRTGYAPVNGLRMYYEIHGEGQPLVLLHGAFSAIGTSFGALLPGLAAGRQIVALEYQAHGRTADIDRPLVVAQLADDTLAALDHLGIARADFFGYSNGAAIALDLALRHPARVRKLVLASISISLDGMHPGLLDGIAQLQPEHLAGSPFAEEYARIAPRPEDFPILVEKMKDLDSRLPTWTEEEFRSLQAPALLVFGDSDIITPEHAVKLFRLLGGGVAGDIAGMPASQLAILPGTGHAMLTQRADLFLAIVPPFLDAPLPGSA